MHNPLPQVNALIFVPALLDAYPDERAIKEVIADFCHDAPEEQRFLGAMLEAYLLMERLYESERNIPRAQPLEVRLKQFIQGDFSVGLEYRRALGEAYAQWDEVGANNDKQGYLELYGFRDMHALYQVAKDVLERRFGEPLGQRYASSLAVLLVANHDYHLHYTKDESAQDTADRIHTEACLAAPQTQLVEALDRYDINIFAHISLAEIGSREAYALDEREHRTTYQGIYLATCPLVSQAFSLYRNQSDAGCDSTNPWSMVRLENYEDYFPEAPFDYIVTIRAIDSELYGGDWGFPGSEPFLAANVIASCAAMLKPGGLMVHQATHPIDSSQHPALRDVLGAEEVFFSVGMSKNVWIWRKSVEPTIPLTELSFALWVHLAYMREEIPFYLSVTSFMDGYKPLPGEKREVDRLLKSLRNIVGNDASDLELCTLAMQLEERCHGDYLPYSSTAVKVVNMLHSVEASLIASGLMEEGQHVNADTLLGMDDRVIAVAVTDYHPQKEVRDAQLLK